MVLEFKCHKLASIKSFAVKEQSSVNVTTRFMSRKLLMFAKLSLMSFIYDITETFHFPDEKVKEIYNKYQIERAEVFHILTETNSTSLKFIFISDPNSKIPEKKIL